MQIRPTLAIADDTHFYQLGKKIPHGEVRNLEMLLEEIGKTNFTHVWIPSGAKISEDARGADWSKTSGKWDAFATRTKAGAAKFARAWRSDKQGQTLYVGVAEHGSWPWQDTASVRTLLATITYIENALGLPIEWGSGHMGLEFLKKENSDRRYHWLTPIKKDWQSVKWLDEAREPIHWKRGVLPENKKWLIKIDKNSEYTGAMTGLKCGEGEPREVLKADFDYGKQGIWEVSVERFESCFDGVHLPTLENYKRMTTDMISQAERLGYKVTVTKGWQWDQYHRTLASTAEKLWEQRKELRAKRDISQAHANAYASISQIMHKLPGKLASPLTKDERLRRRDIWALIESKATCGMLYNLDTIRKLEDEDGSKIEIVLVDADAVLIACNTRDIKKIMGGMIDRDKLGAFKDEWAIEINQAVRDEWAKLEPVALMGKLNKFSEMLEPFTV